MTWGSFFRVVAAAIAAALNTGFYVADGSPWSLGAATFCWAMFVAILAVAVKS